MMKKQLSRKVTALTMTAMMTLLGAQAAFAESITPVRPILLPIAEPIADDANGAIRVTGVVEYSELEGGFYTVDGWSLMGDESTIAQFAALEGEWVTVLGTEFDGISIRMVRTLVVSDLRHHAQDPNTPVNADVLPIMAKSFEVKGTVEYVDIEGGYYAVDGWRLVGDADVFKRYAGQTLFAEGFESTDASIYMNQALVVYAMTPISAVGERGEKEILPIVNPDPELISAPSAPEDGVAPVRLTLTGTVEYNDLEGGFYTVDGHGLMGLDKAVLQRLLGTTITVEGTRFDGASIYMTEQIEVRSIKRAVSAQQSLPTNIVVRGNAVAFDQAPVLVDGTLMVPLRFVVEAAGGSVTWNQAERAVSVRLNDRTATFVIGQDQAEMNQDGHAYFVRNMLPMTKAPMIKGDRTLISAERSTPYWDSSSPWRPRLRRIWCSSSSTV